MSHGEAYKRRCSLKLALQAIKTDVWASTSVFMPRDSCGGNLRDQFLEMRETMCSFIQMKHACPVKSEPVRDDNCTYEIENGFIDVVDLDCRNRWAYRHRICNNDGKEIYRDEVTIITRSDRVDAYFVRFVYEFLDQDHPDNKLFRNPDFLSLVTSLQLTDGLTVQDRPHIFESIEHGRDLWRYLDSPDRTMTVILFTEGSNGFPGKPSELAKETFGIAQVVLVKKQALHALQQEHPRLCECRIQGNRMHIVFPGWVIPGKDTHSIHTLNSLVEFAKGRIGEEEFSVVADIFDPRSIVEFCKSTPSCVMLHKKYVSYSYILDGVNQIVKKLKDTELKSRVQALESSLGEVRTEAKQVSEDVQTLEDLVQELEQANLKLINEKNQLQERYETELAERKRLEELLWQKKPELAAKVIDYPSSYEHMASWVEERFSGKLELHPRAIRELKSAQYQDVELVYKAIELLAIEYREMRMASQETSKDKRRAFSDKMAKLHLGFTAKDRGCHQWVDYKVQYPVGKKGRTHYLSSHLKRGNQHDPKTCLRIYFFWHAKAKIVVVGSLPEHLRNTLT